MISQSVDLERTQAQLFRAIGRRRPPAGWPVGDYVGQIALIRGGTVIDTQSIAIALD